VKANGRPSVTKDFRVRWRSMTGILAALPASPAASRRAWQKSGFVLFRARSASDFDGKFETRRAAGRPWAWLAGLIAAGLIGPWATAPAA